jgi:hypothetical protein
MFGLVFWVETFVWRHASAWTHTVVLDWSATADALARPASRCDVLCFGSSMVKFGVLPRAIEGRTGLRGYNLALLNGPPPASYFLLSRALALGARPAVVVVDFDHNRLEADPRSDHFNYPWADLLNPAEAFDLAMRTRDSGLFGRIVVGAHVPSVRRRHEIRAAVIHKLGGYGVSLDQINSAFGSKRAIERNRRVNRGAVVNTSAPSLERAAAPRVEKDRSATWRLHPINVRYIERFLALCVERKIEVFWLVPPVSPRQQAIDDREGAEPRALRAVWQLAQRHSHVTFVDGRYAGFPTSVYIDHVHLDRPGAGALSRSLAPLIRAAGHVGGPRWIELPPYRPVAPGAEVEDIGQSEIALRTAENRARR